MSTTNLTSTLTKKYPRSILLNRSGDQPRADRTNENLIQNNFVDDSYPLNASAITYNAVDCQQLAATTNYLNPILNPTTSNQPIYESQISYNPATGQHEQQLVTCEQYYSSINKHLERTEYAGCLASFLNYDFQLSIDSWRRKLLILILIINAIMAIANAAIIIWIVSYYYLSIVSFLIPSSFCEILILY